MNSPFHPKTIQVPGILSDDALQEQLKQFAGSKNTLQDAAPPPNSAVDFADKVQSEFLDKKGPAIRAPQAPPAAAPERQKQDKAIDVRSNVLSGAGAAIQDPALRSLLLGPAIGLVGEGGPLDALGTLDSPEARQAEAERRAVDAAKEEAAAKTVPQMREELRGIVDEGQTSEGIRAVLMGEEDPLAAPIAEQNKQDQKGIADAQAKRKEAVAALTDPTKQPTQKWWLDAAQAGVRGAYDVPVSALKAPLIAWEAARDLTFLGNDEKSTARAWADTVDATLTKMLPGDKTRAKDFVHELSGGAGSMLGFMLAGFVGGAVGLPAEATTMMVGGLTGATQQFEDAESFNAVGLQKYMSFMLGGAIGLTEAIPINRMLFRADAATGGLVRRMLTNTAAGGIEEFIQEVGQAIGNDAVAKWLYDEKRNFDVASYLKQGVIGALTGGLAGAATSMLHDTGITGQASPPDYVPVEPKDREALATQTIEALDQEFEALPGLPEAIGQTEAERVLGDFTVVNPADVNLAPFPTSEKFTVVDPAIGDIQAGDLNGVGVTLAADQENVPSGMRRVIAPGGIERIIGEKLLEPVADTVANVQPTNDARPVARVVEGPGGAIPVREDGKLEVTHWSSKVLDVVDPARRGTGPLKGVERSRLGTPGSDPNVVDRSYYGVGNPAFSQQFAAENAKLPPRQRGVKAPTDPYHGEGLGPYQHTVAVDPNTIYNWYQDPLNLKAQLDRSAPATEQVTRYEKLIKDAGFKGVYFSESRLGQTAMMFEAAKPERVVDQRYNLPVGEIAAPADFAKPTAKTFTEKGGWAVLTATQEAVGPATAPENVAANEKLRAELTKKKIPYQEVGGSYQGVDQGKSFMVFMPEAEAVKLGKRYKQESVLTRKGLEHADGRLVPAVPEQTVVGDAARQGDFFSTLPNGEAFSVGLDFGGELAPGEAGDLLANIQTPARVAKLMDQVPGVKGIVPYLTEQERERLSKQTAKALVDIFSKMPDPKEMAAVAISGRAKRGWYKRSAEALVDIFGLQDAPRFSALLAALSPQVSVESNAVNALNMWANWVKAGRPTDHKKILKLLGDSVQGDKGEDSALDAWRKNTLEALTNPDALSINLSGPKVSSFMLNLNGVTVEVTNDAWMANFANVDQTLFASAYSKNKDAPAHDARTKIGRKSPGYLAMSAAVRQAAQAATKMTGETWTPAEIQETVWSWAKTLYEKAGAAGENRTAAQIIAAGDMTAEEIGATPDFASLFVSGVYRNILEKGGYDVERLAQSSGERDSGDVRGGRPTSAEGTGIAQRTFDRHLKRAAERLDALRARRKAEEDRGPTFTLAETFDQGGPAVDPLAGLSADDRAFLDENMLANRGTGNRAPLKGEQTRPDQGIPTNPAAPAQAETVDVTLAKISQDVVKLLDATARQGRLTIKGQGVLGQYSRKQDVVRVKTMSDLSTVVHEGGHALYFAASKPLATVIVTHEATVMQAATDLYGGDVATLSNAEHKAEGFAEFFRVYVLHRQFAERKYPALTADFDAVLKREAPTMHAGLQIVAKKFEAWLQLPSAQLVKNKIVSGKQDAKFTAAIKELQDAGFPTWMHEVARKAVETSINRYAGFNDIVSQILNKGQENAGKALDIKRADDPRVLLRLASNSGARAMIEATDGVLGYRSTQSSTRGLRDALLISQGRRVDQNLGTIDPIRQQDFAAYLVALRGIDEYRRLAEGKLERPPFDDITLGDLHITVKELNDTYGTDFVRAAEIVNEYGMGLWKKSFDAGLMSKETYTNGLDRQFYAPLQRDMSDKKKSLGPSALTAGSSIVKRFRGSGRDIIDPMDVLMHKTFALEKIIAKNDAVKALAGLADKAGKAGALVERVPANQLIGKQFSVKEIARQLTKDDTISEADAEDLMTILQASIEDDSVLSLFRSEQASTKGENIVFFWDSGRLAAIQLADGDLGADVVNTLNGIGRENMPLLVDLVAATSTAFRAAITSWPDFLAVNFIRDQLSAFILTDVGFKPFYTGIKGTFDELRQRQWAKQYNAAMGIMGGMNVATLHDARVNRDIGALRKKGYLAKAFNQGGMLGAVKGMANIAELTETGTRVGIYKNAFERARKDGLNDYEASIEAGYTATDYMDFGLNGSKMLLWRRTIPFLNAQLQGLYKMMRTLGADEVRQRKGLNFVLKSYLKSTKNLDLSRTEKMAIQTGRKAWVKMMSLGLLSAALHFLFEDDPDYQEAGEYLRTTGWVIPLGDGKIFYVPKPFELAVFANFVERGLEAANGDQSAKGRFMRGLAMNLVPPTSPPAIQIGVELAANYDFFADREIVPSYMQALAPELQFNNYTSELAKSIGQATGVSPMVLDHIMSGLGASAYRDMSTMTNALDPNRPNMDATDAPILRRFIRDARRGSASSKDFWGIASTLNGSLRQAETTYKAYLEAGNENAANEFLATLDEDDRAYALLTTHFKADAKKLNPFYRGRQLTTIVSALRREMVSPLGMEDTSTKIGGEIKLTSREKADLDEALSEYARREMRNTLIAMGAPGWTGKKPLPADSTVELIRAIEPRAADELERRVKKAGVYSFDTVNTYWPEVKDRLLRDHENTFLKDILTIAKVMR